VKINLRIAALAAALSLYGAATAGAQQEEHKPGGLNKVAHDISKTSKKAGSNLRAVCQLGEAPAWRDGLELTMPVLVLDASDTPVVQAHIRMWVTARKRG